MKKYEWFVVVASLYLAVYVVMFGLGAPLQVMAGMFAFSPIPVIYMVYQVLVNAVYKGKTLTQHQEYGYADRPNPTTLM